MTMPLLTTKLYLPPPPPKLVPRARLIAHLDTGLDLGHKLILISAPAGFGKTTLVSEWSHGVRSKKYEAGKEHAGVDQVSPTAYSLLPTARFAWLSLDAGDNDPLRFWTYFIAALQTIQADVGNTALAMLQAPGFAAASTSPHELMLTALLNEIAAAPHDFVLILDDYHVIDNPLIHEALTFLLDHLPPQLHLVITTRVDPPFPLSRLRARQQLTELRAADLRFTQAEVKVFLDRAMALNLPTEAVVALSHRTEGWITGLQLAALSMQGQAAADQARFVTAFTGSHRYILDYLTDEVIQRQPPDRQAFLLETSILSRLSGPLCDAVTGRDDSQTALEHLELANLFVIPLDDERRWYRYHHLFADFLRAYLQKSVGQEKWMDLQRRAGAWLAQHDLIAEAIHHMLLAEDFVQAGRLIEQLVPSMLTQGGVVTLRNWLDKLSPKLLFSHPLLNIARAWVMVMLNTWDEIEAVLRGVESSLAAAQDSEDPEVRQNRGMVTVVRMVMANNRSEASQAIEYAQRALELLPDDHLIMRSVIMRNLGTAFELQGKLTAASQALTEAIALSQATDNLVTTLHALNNLARLHVEQAHLHRAAQLHQQALQLVKTWGQKHQQPDLRLPNSGLAYLGLADVYREWNDLKTARKFAMTALDMGEQWNIRDTIQVAHITLARILQAQGDGDGAAQAIQQAGQAAQKQSPYASWIAAMQARVWLLQGNLAAAAHWVEGCELPLDAGLCYYAQFPDEYATLVRVHLAQGQVQSALALLEPMQAQAEATDRTGRVIEIAVLYALAFYAQGDVQSACAPLIRALSLAEPAGYMRIFVDQGAAMARLLRLTKSRGVALDYIDKLLAAFPDVEVVSVAPPLQRRSSSPLIEPLSQRELQVLRLLSTGLSNQEIATELIIATGTVKKHVHNIFGKLGVRNRSQAILRAEELHLLK